MEKRIYIKDPLWKTIELSSWEGEVLKQSYFNRLHSVLQNSSAYKVYPGMRNTRFMHSLGALHVASKIFLGACVNTERSILDLLVKEADAASSKFDPSEIKQIAEWCFSHGCPRKLAVLYCGIRLSALCHDIGHLSYSHIFEFALDTAISSDSRKRLWEKLLGTSDEMEESKETASVFSELRQAILPDGTKKSDKKLHESIGQRVLAAMALDCSGIVSKLLQLAGEILHGESFPIARSFLEQDIDADRIDFVARDGFFSGAFSTSVDHSRLFASYEIATYDDEKGDFRARPSSRASGEAEKLLFERFQDYLHVAGHHKVHLFDELLERIILFAMLSGRLNHLLRSVGNLVSLAPAITERLRERSAQAKRDLIQSGDDSALDVLIREIHATVVDDPSKLPAQVVSWVEAFFERRDLYRTVFKTGRALDPEVRAFLSSESSGGIPELLTRITQVVRKNRFDMERSIEAAIGRSKHFVVVGDLHRKLKIGIDGSDSARFFGLASLEGFLLDKLGESSPFNIWIRCDSPDTDWDKLRSKVIDVAFDFIRDKAGMTKSLIDYRNRSEQ